MAYWPISYQAQGTGASDGTLTVAFVPTPAPGRWWAVDTISTRCASPNAVAQVQAGPDVKGYIFGLNRGQAGGFLMASGNRLALVCSGLAAGELLTVWITGRETDDPESVNLVPTFAASPTSAPALQTVSFSQQGFTDIILKAANQSITVYAYVLGATGSVARSGGAVDMTVRFTDENSNIYLDNIMQIYVPASINTSYPGMMWSPFQAVPGGFLCPGSNGHGLRVSMNFTLTSGHVFGTVWFIQASTQPGQGAGSPNIQV